MDENEIRERSFVIPFIYILFFLCVTTGGVLLVIYVFFPAYSKPWHPTAALALIGSTWLFWLLTYIYSCIKHWVRSRGGDRPPGAPARQITRNASVSVTPAAAPAAAKPDPSEASAGTSENPRTSAA